jgi:hypothetical protein
MVMIALVAIGGLVVLLVLVDLTDLWRVRSGKRSIFRGRAMPVGDLIGPTSSAGTDHPYRNSQDLTG